MARARTVFFGSGPFALAVLDAVATEPVLDAVAVVTTPPRPAGRRAVPAPTPVHARAMELGLVVLTPERLRDPAFGDALRDLAPGVGILADYGKLVPPGVLDRLPHGILNLHPSLLPRHRGATPIPAAILAGDQETGVTLFVMDAGLDTGPMVAVERLAIGEDEDAPHLEARLAAVAVELLSRSISGYLRGDLRPSPQPDAGASLTRPLQREDGRLDPAMSAPDLQRRVRAYRPWPGTYLEFPGGRLAVLEATVAADDPERADDGRPEPGTLVAAGQGLALATGAGRLVLDRVQPAGGRPMDGAAYRRGRPAVVGLRAVARSPEPVR